MNLESIAKGVGITALAKISANVLSWGATICVIRWLSPTDYGLVATASVLADFLIQFLDATVLTDVLRRQWLSRRRAQYYSGSIVILALFSSMMLMLSGPFFAEFLSQQILTWIFIAKGVELLAAALLIVPEARLMRALNTNMQAVLIFASTASGAIASLCLAWLGFGVWALLTGFLTQRISKLVILGFWGRDLLLRPKLSIKMTVSQIRQNISIINNRILYIAYDHIPTLISGRVLGPKETGLYSTSYYLAGIPGSRAMTIINQVALPVYSKLQSNSEAFVSSIIRGLRLLILVYLPCIVGLAAVGDLFVEIVLGPKWLDATPVFVLMCLGWAIRSVWDFFENPMIAAVQEKLLSKMQYFRITVLILGCFALSSQGAKGFAIVFCSVSMISMLMTLFISCPQLNIPPKAVAGIIFRGASSCIVMSLVVRFAVYELAGFASVIRLIVAIFCGVLTYCCMSVILQLSSVKELLNLVKLATKRKA